MLLKRNPTPRFNPLKRLLYIYNIFSLILQQHSQNHQFAKVFKLMFWRLQTVSLWLVHFQKAAFQLAKSATKLESIWKHARYFGRKVFWEKKSDSLKWIEIFIKKLFSVQCSDFGVWQNWIFRCVYIYSICTICKNKWAKSKIVSVFRFFRISGFLILA